jgi:hypothetical protein
MKTAAAEQPDNDQIDRSDIVQRSRHHKNENAASLRLRCVCLIGIRWPVCRSQYDSGSTQYKEYESNDQNESKYAAADVHVDLQVVRLSGQWNIKGTQQSVRHRTYQYFDTQRCQVYRCVPLCTTGLVSERSPGASGRARSHARPRGALSGEPKRSGAPSATPRSLALASLLTESDVNELQSVCDSLDTHADRASVRQRTDESRDRAHLRH